MGKDIVQIRSRLMKSGKKTLYLAYRVNGKRYYEYPKLYLLPEAGKNKSEIVRKNKETMRIVKAMQAKKILELTQNRGGIYIKKEPSKMLFIEWLDDFVQKKRATTEASISTLEGTYKHLKEYIGKETTFADIDKRLCEGFIEYLEKSSKHLKLSSIKMYTTKFSTLLRVATRNGLLSSNPFDLIKRDYKRQTIESERVFLTIEEVKRMAVVKPKNDATRTVKQAFMFSCFCGLRISDIRQLKWKDIEKFVDVDGKEKYRLSVNMKKTKKNVNFILSNEAIKWLPERNGTNVFGNMPEYQCTINGYIKSMAMAAGITKNISFHTARHTFATMMLSLGADLYTTSKLLGHTRIATTEIYAKIIDKKKDEAMGLIDKFFD